MLFGIAALVITGLSWTLVGIIMGNARKHDVNTSLILLFGSGISCAVSLVVCIGGGAFERIACGWIVTLMTCGSFVLSGILNFVLLQCMAAAMRVGPNGVVWTIIQSGLIFPFMMGIVWFGVPLNPLRGVGIILILAALVLFGLGKGQSCGGTGESRGWVRLAFLAFLVCGMQQCFANGPSYFPQAESISSVVRTLSAAAGILVAAVVYTIATWSVQGKAVLLNTVRNRWLWIYVGGLQGFSLFAAYVLLYRGMNALANAGIGAVAYPLLVGSCIIGFSIYSLVILREKGSCKQYFALIACLGGIVAVCIK